MELYNSIIEQASDLFLHRGLKAVSMDDIAKAVGISKRTLYENFNSKDELLSDCISYIESKRKERLSELCKEAKDVIDILLTVTHDMATNLSTISPLFLQDLNLYHFRLANDLFNKQRDEQLEGIKKMLSKGKAEGYFVKEVNEGLVGELMTVTQRASMSIVSSGRYAYDTILKHIVLCFIRGIATEKGRVRIDEEFMKLN